MICEGGACIEVPGSGPNTCSAFIGCASHTECAGASCVIRPGSQTNECVLALGCSIGPTHLACNGSACISVPGGGGNLCNTAFGCGTATHAECSSGLCISVSGAGTNNCTVGQACAYGACGNGSVDAGEQCDLGVNNSNNITDRCRASCVFPTCGDGVTDTGEQCDDGNIRTGDGCTNTCIRETVSIAGVPLCGDGTLSSPETCDDGNRVSGDGCSTSCTIESQVLGMLRCGDGIVTEGEGCDDGNVSRGDGCDSTCHREITKQCTAAHQCATRFCTPEFVCAACTKSSDCASGECTAEGKCTDTDMVRVAALARLCGNGTLESPEECDDNNKRNGDGCAASCSLERGLCGDGIVQRALDEVCEPSLHDRRLPYSCDPMTCRLFSNTCGDGKMDHGEECDSGVERNTNQSGSTCRPDCSRLRCGDSVRDLQEYCDDGNTLDGDGCSSTCQLDVHAAPSTIAFPGTNFGIAGLTAQYPFPDSRALPWQLPLASLQPLTASRAPVGDTGPAAVAVIAAGAASGVAWMRRKRREA